MKSPLEEHCKTGFFMLKLHLLDQVGMNLEALERTNIVLSLQPFKVHTVHIRNAYLNSFQRNQSQEKENMNVLEIIIKI